jgi:uncharacterized protein
MSAYVSQYVLKVCSRCDLACDHCYVFEHADQSWRHKPKVMAVETVVQAARRISEHAEQHRLAQVSVVIHGGEPLLVGPERMRGVIGALRSAIDPVTKLVLTVHTNGVLLDEELCDLFAEYGVRVGVSLDGDRAANDRHRRYADGRSSHAQALRALALLRQPEYRHLYAGILCTIDVDNDPIAVYEALLAEEPPHLDLLLPHATWESPPARAVSGRVPYADWLGRVHARWVADGCPVPIRFFDSLLRAWAGRPSGSEATGLDRVGLLTIDTDGGWEQSDSLKTAYDGAPRTGLEIFSASADQAAAHSGPAGRRQGLGGVPGACRACAIVRACGGGLRAHRYRSENGFDNPSVYCDDLKVMVPQVLDSAPRRAARGPVNAESRRHRLAVEDFDLLAAGPGGRAAMTVLSDAMHSTSRMYMRQAGASVGGASGDLGRAAADGWRLLLELDRDYPQAVREVLMYPYVRAWAERWNRKRKGGTDLALAHLGGIAAAAALRAGVEATVTVPVRAGVIHVPTVGAAAVAAPTRSVARLQIAASRLSSVDGLGKWRPVRRFADAGLTVTVDDVDPFRGCQAWTPARRLTAAAWAASRRALSAAVTQLGSEVPDYAEVLRAGLRSVVPIAAGNEGMRQSGSSGRAFGAVAVALPDEAGSLGELLLHEMQHVKLGALIDMYDLFKPEDGSLFSVPWRSDERPFEGALHGVYAHLGVAELWRSRALAEPAGETVNRYRIYHSWVEDAIEMLLTTGRLLPAGERFVEGMRATVKSWADDW